MAFSSWSATPGSNSTVGGIAIGEGTTIVSSLNDALRQIMGEIRAVLPAIDAAVTATHAELNILDGVTAVAADLNLLAGAAAAGADSVVSVHQTIATSPYEFTGLAAGAVYEFYGANILLATPGAEVPVYAVQGNAGGYAAAGNMTSGGIVTSTAAPYVVGDLYANESAVIGKTGLNPVNPMVFKLTLFTGSGSIYSQLLSSAMYINTSTGWETFMAQAVWNEPATKVKFEPASGVLTGTIRMVRIL